MKKMILLLFLPLAFFLLCACGKSDLPTTTADPSDVPTAIPVTSAYLRYVESENRSFDLVYCDHDFSSSALFLLGERNNSPVLLSVTMTEGNDTELPLDKAFSQVAVGAEHLWLGKETELVCLSTDGNQILSLNLPEKIEDLCCDGIGRLYAAHRNSLTIVSPEGETESIALPKGFTGGTLCRLGSGEIAVYASRIKGEVSQFQRISGNGLAPLETGEIRIGTLASGDAAADFYYVERSNNKLISDASQVFRFSDGKATPVFDLAGVEREGKILGLYPYEADYLLLYEEDGGVGLLRLKATEAEKKMLTIARLNNNHFVTDLIARFNRENPDYYLVNRYYYGDSTEAQSEQLELDILAGDRPDLLDTMLANLESYGAKGIIRDLYPMIDADPTISREDLVPSVLHAMEAGNGALYRLWPEFSLWTCAEPAAYVGNAERWTLEDLYRICSENPDLTLCGGRSGGNLLDFLLTGVVDDFADFETLELHFDTPEFVEFLAFLQEMDQRAMNYTSGDALLSIIHFSSVDDFSRTVSSPEAEMLRFTGYPCGGGTGHRCYGEISFAIFEGTGNEEDAWAFLRWFLSEEVQESVEKLPMRRSVLEARLEAAKNGTPETTVTKYVDPSAAVSGENTETVTYTLPAVPPMPEDQITLFRSIVEGAESVYNDSLTHPCYNVIWEECVNLFKGSKNPEDTAKAIQDRLSIYLAERSK